MEEAANPDRTAALAWLRAQARRTSLIWGVLCAGLLVQCTSIEKATRVAITLDAAPELRARIKHVDLVFYAAISQDAWRMRAQERLRPDSERAWPLQWSFARENAQDTRYSLEAQALDADGKKVAELRAFGDFRDQETVQLSRSFDASCKQACGEAETCREGACVDAAVMTASMSTGSQQRPDAGSDAGAAKSGMTPSPAAACRPGDAACKDECGPSHGGCDPVVSCKMEQGKPRCGDCPDGFAQETDGSCSALLRDLSAEGATLDPSFRPDRTEYTLKTGLIANQWRLTPTAADGVMLTIDGKVLASGAAITPQLVAAGTDQVTLEVNKSREYHVKLEADGEELSDLKAATPTPDAYYGHRIAFSGDTLVVSATGDSSSARGINPVDPPRDGAANSGAVYVYRRQGSRWELEAYIKAGDAQKDARFGKCVELVGDTLIVGAWYDNDRGAAYVFQRTGTSWREQTKLVPEMQQDGANFGQSATLRDDMLVIGAGTYDVGASDTGAAFVFRRNPADQSWAYERMISPDMPMAVTWFGSSVLLGSGYLIVGATGEGNGSVASGTTYVFDAQTFEQLDVLRPSMAAATGFFGERTAIAGDTLAISSFNNNAGLSNGVVYIFKRKADGKFEQHSALQASNASGGDQFGTGLALTEDYLLVGAAHEKSGTRGINGALSAPELDDSGAAYLFARRGDNFDQIAHIKASEPAAGAQFGADVAINGADIAVAADLDPRAASGSGAVYLFR